MPISIKSEKEIELMRESGRILSKVLNELQGMIHAGISTLDIDKKCSELIKQYGCIPSFLNYNGYPASICISVNDEVVHGIPSKNRILRDGDIVSLDGGVIYQGFHSDAARTVAVGEISKEARRLIEVTQQSF
jgi:methionyl aminopeptidase